MVRPRVVLTYVIREILRPQGPNYYEIIFPYLITAIKISHFEHPRSLPLDGAIDDPYRRLIVGVDRCWWLWVAKLLKG